METFFRFILVNLLVLTGCAKATPPKFSFQWDPSPQVQARKNLAKFLVVDFQGHKRNFSIPSGNLPNSIETDSEDWDFGQNGPVSAVACDESREPLLWATSPFDSGQKQVDLTLSSLPENSQRSWCEAP